MGEQDEMGNESRGGPVDTHQTARYNGRVHSKFLFKG